MAITEDNIRRKAYQLWEQRGCPLGSEDIDWFEARCLLLASAEFADSSPETPSQESPRYGLRQLASD